MRSLLYSLSPRQIVLAGITGTVVLCAMIVGRSIFPVYDEWQEMKSLVRLQSLEHDRLSRNLAIKQEVEEEASRLKPSVYQLESDAITLSQFLRELEVLGRHPSMTLSNAKALPVEDKGAYKIYRVRLSVAGKLQEILQFVSDMTSGNTVVGLEGSALRGVQGGAMAECSLSMRMIRLVPRAADESAAGIAAQLGGGRKGDGN